MIRRSSILQTVTSYVPKSEPDSDTDIESLWQEWVLMESCKRCDALFSLQVELLMSVTPRALITCFLHDCCQELYFAAPTYFKISEMTICLPCEDALWNASSAAAWYTVLHMPSSYGSPADRLRGVSTPSAMNNMCALRQLDTPLKITPFGLFVLAHAILCDLYLTCTRKNLQETPRDGDEGIDPDILKAQYGLHNMLICWVASPDVLSHTPTTTEEPPFFNYGKPS